MVLREVLAPPLCAVQILGCLPTWKHHHCRMARISGSR